MGEDPYVIRRQLERTRDELTETIDALGYKADVPARAKERVTGTFDRARESVMGTSNAMRDATPDSGQVADQARRAAGVAQENPLGLAIGSIAAGFLLGMLVPSSRLEDERLGPIAHEAREQVTELGQEALAHGKEVASEAAEAATDAARRGAEEHAANLRDAASEHARAVGEQVRSG
jgi:hypothetical protein